MNKNCAYPDGLDVTLSTEDESIHKKLMADGDNQISLNGVAVYLHETGYEVVTAHPGGGGGGSPSSNPNSAQVLGVTSSGGGVGVGRGATSRPVTIAAGGGVASDSCGASGGISATGGMKIQPTKKVTISFGDEAFKR